MDCILCNGPISEARLKARPHAALCIDCASQNDVPLIRRYDDHTAQGDVSETYYIHNPAIVAEVERLRNFNPYEVVEEPVEGEEPEVGHVDFRPVDTPPHQLTPIPTLYYTNSASGARRKPNSKNPEN
jgi:Prokaryotic dksA/traR C4-type zinc finger